MDHIQINAIEKFHFDNFTRIAQDSNFKSDLERHLEGLRFKYSEEIERGGVSKEDIIETITEVHGACNGEEDE